MRGAERVFDAIAQCWPEAPIYTTVYSEEGTEGRFSSRSITTSRLDSLPVSQRNFRMLMPLYPRAVERLPLAGHDLVVSSSSAFAHGVRPSPDAVHICACHTPFRYAWYEREIARSSVPRPLRGLLERRLARQRRWDREAAARVTHYIALSSLARERIEEAFGREAAVVFPGVELERFAPAPAEDYFLIVGHLVAHKGVDLALEAARRAAVPVQVVGDGPELRRLQGRFGESAVFHGAIGDEALASLYARARAVVMPGVEEFGLVALEAQASGRPVLALGRGGVLDTVIDGETGVLLADDRVDTFAEAMREVDFDAFDRGRLRAQAERFSTEEFKRRFRAEVERLAGAGA